MKGGKTTTKEKICITLLSIFLWVELAVIGLAIGFDVWVTKPATENEQQWMVGLWRSCLVPATNNTGTVALYPNNKYNCTTITNLKKLGSDAVSGDWNIELQILSFVLILLSAAMTVAAHIFFACGYIPSAKCKTCGLGGLPAVLIASGVSQVSCLLAVYYMANQVMILQLSYYLIIANLVPTWLTAIATLIVTCRVS